MTAGWLKKKKHIPQKKIQKLTPGLSPETATPYSPNMSVTAKAVD